MSPVSPAEAHCPIRQQNQHSVSGDRGRARHRIAVCFGMGERTGKLSEVLPVDASEEVVEAEEESQPVNPLPSPDMPTQSERDEHDISHYPYRCWCEHCVEGRGIEMGHRLGDDHNSRGVAVIGFDTCL